jgi:methyl-accepting chemotaxis protein
MNWFNNLNATPRLMLGFGILLLLSLVTGIFAISRLSESNSQLGELYSRDMKATILAKDLSVLRMELGRQDRDAILHMANPTVVAADERVIHEDLGKLRTELEMAGKILDTSQGLEMVRTLHDATPQYEESMNNILQRVDAGDRAGSEAGLVKLQEQAKPMNKAVEALSSFEQARAEEKFQAGNVALHSSILLVMIAIAMSVGAGVTMSIVIARTFSVPLREAVTTLQQVADGDLVVSLNLHTTDEMGRMAQALNDALRKLRTTLVEVSKSAKFANSSSQELAAAAETMASGAKEQAASLEETSASLEQITATVHQSVDSAKQANQLAASSKVSAEGGEQVVLRAITAMQEINTASAKIHAIISTIDEIAFQTNLLAVNAAVEAARAGEEGRGFAVVASEVRSLALRTTGAAKEIKALIQDSLRKVANGSQLVNQSGETLHEIVSLAKKVTDVVSDMTAASREQSIGIEQVNTAVTRIDQVTQSNSEQTGELSSTARSLMQHAARLTELLATFTLTSELDAATLSRQVESGRTKMARRPALPLANMPQARRSSRPGASSANAASFVEF